MLQPNEQLYAEARVKGLNPEMSAIAAGYPHLDAFVISIELEKNLLVQKYIAENVAVEFEKTQILAKIDPLEFLEARLGDISLDMDTRIKVATQLLPYKHKKVAPTSKPNKREEDEAKLKNAEQGDFGASRPPRGSLKVVS